ncbi:ferredoxin reductase [Saccharothrix coeruleofusca]|uniref:Ferredoxin reductase n=1 Tax=Saccharothrix coeruleofusca TaxID=33919 RepID=A0A918ANR0_9PSEU|nr:ferredoxin reductase [Saccharothrix coeruleofusca]
MVGASLAGLRAAESLRELGFGGTLVVVGDEPHMPYDRPPLSKALLAGAVPAGGVAFPVAADLDVDWRLGCPAARLDPRGRVVETADGTTLPYDGLVIATGAAARGWTGPGTAPDRGVLTVRGLDDALALRSALRAAREGGRRLVVVGAGFLGSEVAAVARSAGVAVTLVDPAAQPLERALGSVVGGFVAQAHREHGVDLRLSTTVVELAGAGGGVRAVLSDGDRVTGAAVVLALGAVPNTGWLRGSGLDVVGGVACDRFGRVRTTRGRFLPDVVAAGDVCRVPEPLAGGALVNQGHWTSAAEQARTAAATLLHGPGPLEPRVPSFWSDQYDLRIRSVGLPHLADGQQVLELDPRGRRAEVLHHRGGELVGAVTVNRTGRLAAHRRTLLDLVAAPFR